MAGYSSSPVLLIAGPTAVGKTQLVLRLADAHPDIDLISMDSVMVYRGLNIGTAKPSPTALQHYPHALIDIRDPADVYSAADFLTDASALVVRSLDAGRTPVLIGGTMLYFNLLRSGLSVLPSADTKVRTRITELAGKEGWSGVRARLAELDPDTAARLSPNDSQRLARALEICWLTQSTLTQQQCHRRLPTLAEVLAQAGHSSRLLWFGLWPASRTLLRERIADRFLAMRKRGLVQEVKQLATRPDLHDSLPAMRALGYRQVYACLQKRLSWEDLNERAITATRQMAKRQLTWMRGWKDLIPLPEKPASALQVLRKNLT